VVRQCIPKLRAAALKAAAAEEEVTVRSVNKFAERERRLRIENEVYAVTSPSICCDATSEHTKYIL